jgi:hypothetical protein
MWTDTSSPRQRARPTLRRGHPSGIPRETGGVRRAIAHVVQGREPFGFDGRSGCGSALVVRERDAILDSIRIEPLGCSEVVRPLLGMTARRVGRGADGLPALSGYDLGPRACSSVDRASASGAEGRRFESCRARQYLSPRQYPLLRRPAPPPWSVSSQTAGWPTADSRNHRACPDAVTGCALGSRSDRSRGGPGDFRYLGEYGRSDDLAWGRGPWRRRT